MPSIGIKEWPPHSISGVQKELVCSTPPAPWRAVQALILLEKSRIGALTVSTTGAAITLRRSTSKGERPRTPPSRHFSSSLHPRLHLGISQPNFKISQLLTMATGCTAKKPRVEEVAATSQEPSATVNGGADRISSLPNAILSSIICLLPTDNVAHTRV
jgi:hypothetical protein